MTTVRWDVLGMGVIAVDDLIYVDHYPEPDTKMQAQEMRRYGGGLAATAMVAAARLGARAAFYAFLGDDELSQFSREQLALEHVDHAPVISCPGARPYHSVVIVDTGTGQRTIVYSVDGVRHLTPEDVDPALVKACRLLFVDHHVAEAGLRAMEIAHQNGIPAVADIEHVPDRATAQLLDQVDHLVVGIELGKAVTGENEPERVVRGAGQGRPRLHRGHGRRSRLLVRRKGLRGPSRAGFPGGRRRYDWLW